MHKSLDLSRASEYDLTVEKGRTLNAPIECKYYDTTNTLQTFEFLDEVHPYTGGTMTIKNTAGTILMTFSTTDGSMTLGALGVLTLSKTAAEMDVVRAGSYSYDLYISNDLYPKRNFLRGTITFIQNISN